MKKIYALLIAAVAAPTLMFAQPINSTCDTAPVTDLVIDGPTVTVTGSGTDAIDSEALGQAHVWEAFTITDCASITLDFCGTPTDQVNAYLSLFNSCPIGTTADDVVPASSYDLTSCTEGSNITINYNSVPAGTYYYAVMSSAGSQILDDYTLNYTAMACPAEPDTCLSYDSGPYTDFNTAGGAPTPDENGVCESVSMAFGCWASESYTIDGFVADVMYTFSICDGTGAGSWAPALSVTDPNGDLVAYVEDCAVSWTTTMDGTYVIGISEVDHCYDTQNTNVDNGNPTLTCEGGVSVSEVEKADFSIFPNPNNGQFSIRNAGVAGNYNIQVLDMAGRIVFSQKSILSSNTLVDVNMNEVANGVYMVKMTNTLDNSSTTQRVVVQ